jgi:hypothetical protein
MPVRGGALSAKGLAPDDLQLPLQGLPAFSGAAWSMSMFVRDDDFEVLSGQHCFTRPSEQI